MSFVIISLVAAAAAGVSGALAARAIRKRRAARSLEQAEAAAEAEERSAPDPFEGLPLRTGDVVQFGNATRWPNSAILVYGDNNRLHAAILLSTEEGREDATVTFPPPDRNLYWLTKRDIVLPPTPPSRIEVAGMLIDRKAVLPVHFKTIGDVPDIGDGGMFGFYEGSVGDAAVVLRGDITRIWYGQRLSPDDFDNLGQVDNKS
jgi:hypothetical protein